MTRPWLSYIWVLVSLENLIALRPIGAACIVRLELDAQASKIALESSNTLEIGTSKFESPAVYDSSIERGFSGALYAVSQVLRTCPVDRTAWLVNWPSFTLTSMANFTTYNQPISVYPTLHLGKTMLAGSTAAQYLYDYNISDMRAMFHLGEFTAVSSQPGNFTANVRTQLVDGRLTSFSFLTGMRVDDLTSLSGNASGVGLSLDVKTEGAIKTLVLDVPSLRLTYQAAGRLNISGALYTSRANHTLTSRLRATAILDCSTYCGDYGRCEVIGGTAQCICDCGWSADSSRQCNTPSGYCDASGGGTVTAPTTCTSTGILTSVPSTNGYCPTGYDFDPNGTNCDACPRGFTGSGCRMCMSDTACQTRLSSSTAQCYRSTLYHPRTSAKEYNCTVLDDGIRGFLGATIHFNCSTTKPALTSTSISNLDISSSLMSSSTPVNSTPYCQVSFRLNGMAPGTAVVCTGWGCTFGVNSSRVNCPYVQCNCPKGCTTPLISESTFKNLRTDVRMTCGGDTDGTGNCTLGLSGLSFLPPISLSCSAFECLDPQNGSVTLTSIGLEKKDPAAVAPIIALIPTMVLVLAAAAAVTSVVSFNGAAGPGPSTQFTGETRNGAVVEPAGPRAEGVESPEGQSGTSPPSASAAGGAAASGSSSSNTGASGHIGDGNGKHNAARTDTTGNIMAVELGNPPASIIRPMVQVLSWHGLYLRARRSNRPLGRLQADSILLSNVSGVANSGEILGILGPSGSGKTTLLSVLAGLIQPGLHWQLDGDVRLDGHTVTAPRHLAALTGHVPQHDVFYRSLTITECVTSSAALRLSWQELQRGRSYVQNRIASVLRELGIMHLANRVVWPGDGSTLLPAGGSSGGAAGTTLSGGERLRVAAALELVSDPPLLLLDEPLSGLDAATAKATLAVLRNVASGNHHGGSGAAASPGRILVASLHQPSPVLFAALDSVLLMAGGRVVASGTPSSIAAVLAAAEVPLPPPDVHIAEHLLDLVMSDPAQAKRLYDWHIANGGPQLKPADRAITGTVGPEDSAEYILSLVRERSGGASVRVRLQRLWLELGVITWRSGLDMLRNASMLVMHLSVTGALGLLVGAIFSKTDLNVSGAQNRVGAIFFAVMLLACLATSAVDSIYPERTTADRDLLRRSYGILPYMFAKLILDGFLLRALPALVFALPFYWLMGLRHEAAAFFTFVGAFSTMSCISGTASIALSCILPSPGRTVLLLNLLVLTCALFSGFLANKDSIVVWLRWIVYVSPIRFCWEALVINELKPLILSFSGPDLPEGLPAVKGSLFLSLLGVDSGMINTDLIVLDCMYAIVVLVALVSAFLRLVLLRGRWR